MTLALAPWLVLSLAVVPGGIAGTAGTADPVGLDEAGAPAIPDPAAFQEQVEGTLARVLPATVCIQSRGSSGSGVIVSPDGLVLTAAHVISGPDRDVTVIFADDTERPARTLGVNPFRDSGMVRIADARDLPFVRVPAPFSLRAGDWCLTTGHPGGHETGRPPVPRIGRVLDPTGQFLHTDCPLIGGDSGGPLFDLEGRLIGIHSRIQSDVTGNFHVPIDTFRLGWNRLLAGEEWTGSDAKLGLRRIEDAAPGARVLTTVPGRPAAVAGIQEGDVILALNGEVVHDDEHLQWFLGDLRPGDLVVVKVRRGEEVLSPMVTLAGPAHLHASEPEAGTEPKEAEGEAGGTSRFLPVRTAASPAQDGGRGGSGVSRDRYRDAPAVLESFRDLARAASPSVATVLSGDRPVAWATVVGADGWLLTKSSELGEDLVCRLPDGRELPATVRARALAYDLALLKVEAQDLAPIEWSERAPGPGRLVVTVAPEGKVRAFGIVGVMPRTISGSNARLGVVLAFGVEGAVIDRVTENTPAANAGLQAGDRILAINGEEVTDRAAAVETIQGFGSGHSLTLRVRRGDEELTLTPTLMARVTGPGTDRDSRMAGTDQSGLREGFPSALQHDTVLEPEECGGPLLDLDGRALALNIARAGRIATYAIPADAVQEVLARLVLQAVPAGD